MFKYFEKNIHLGLKPSLTNPNTEGICLGKFEHLQRMRAEIGKELSSFYCVCYNASLIITFTFPAASITVSNFLFYIKGNYLLAMWKKNKRQFFIVQTKHSLHCTIQTCLSALWFVKTQAVSSYEGTLLFLLFGFLFSLV